MTDERTKFEAWAVDGRHMGAMEREFAWDAWEAALALQKPVAGLDEVAEKVWRERAWLERPELVQFRDAVRAVVAELTKGQEQIGYVGKHVADALKSGRACTTTMTVHKAFEDDFAVFAAPVITEPAVPTGWKLVPIEPTTEMLKAGCENCDGPTPYAAYRPSEVGEIYRDMLAAAPEVKS